MRFKTQNLVVRLSRCPDPDCGTCTDCTEGPSGCPDSTSFSQGGPLSLACLRNSLLGANLAAYAVKLEERIAELETLLATDRGRELSLEAKEAQLAEVIDALTKEHENVVKERTELREKRKSEE